MKYKDLDLKIQNHKYCSDSYQHLLVSLKDSFRSGEYNQQSLIDMTSSIDNFARDLTDGITSYKKEYNSNWNIIH